MRITGQGAVYVRTMEKNGVESECDGEDEEEDKEQCTGSSREGSGELQFPVNIQQGTI